MHNPSSFTQSDYAMATQSSQDPLINVTDAAALKVHQLVVEEDNFDLNLRAFITGGGCSGFQYEWSMTDETDKGTLLENILVLDKLAEMFVIGCTVDYVTEFGGSYLKVINPNATAQCGCGESFAV